MKRLMFKIMAAALVVAGLVGTVSVGGAAWASGGAAGKVSTKCPANSMRDNYTNSIAECSLPENSPTTGTKKLPEIIQTIVGVVLGVVGIVAVIMIILGGISFVTSQGDAAKVTKARNTLLYGVVGLVIALLAFAIVNFVLSSVFEKEEAVRLPDNAVIAKVNDLY